MPGPSFVSGAQLSGAFYRDVVAPLLAGRPHAAALLGWGSDVLGYDTERSTDHGWGPRLLVLIEDGGDVQELSTQLDIGLPERFEGWPVRYGWDGGTTSHHVTVTTAPAWLDEWLGVDATGGMRLVDWLLTPQQRLLGVVAGQVYADDLGTLSRVRQTLVWYPAEIWRWVLACQWHRLAQEEAFVARTAEVSDQLGSAVTAARLVRDMMRLALLMDRRYAPYQKWLGTAFAGLTHRDGLPAHLTDVLRAPDAPAREDALARAWTALARRHDAAGLSEPVAADIGDYHERPARVLMADRFTRALLDTVTDPGLTALPLVGTVDQALDNTDVLTTPDLYRRLISLYVYD